MKQLLGVVFFLTIAGHAVAESAARYQAISIPVGDASDDYSAVLILDTQLGHVWLWREFRTYGEEGRRSELAYEGAARVPPQALKPEDLFPMLKRRTPDSEGGKATHGSRRDSTN